MLKNNKFRVEFWLYVQGLNGSYADYVGVFDGSQWGWLIYQNGSNLDTYINGSTRISATHPSLNAWHHIALTRDGTNMKMFVDGTQHGSTNTSSNGNDVAGWLQVGGHSASRNSFNGFMDELRITTGVARYTSNFTSPTKAFPNK